MSWKRTNLKMRMSGWMMSWNSSSNWMSWSLRNYWKTTKNLKRRTKKSCWNY